MTAANEILAEQQGGLGIITLNRPQALNTLSLSMYRDFDPKLIAWAKDPGIHAVVVRGAGEKAFCAGGDVRAIYDARHHPKGDGDYKADFFREEYLLVQRVHRFPKPYIALIDGITMGGGMGISINGSHRVATERASFAMPEVNIGLFPDVGGSRFLNHCPGQLGRYLALTARRLKAADAIYAGFATHYVPHDRLADLTAALAAAPWETGREHAQVDAVLARFSEDKWPAPLSALQPEIDRCFRFDTVEEILAALERERAEWATEAAVALRRASPLSLKITLEQLKRGRGMEIEAALALEYRMTQHCMAGHDFFEGIRALLVDKDQKPVWQHASLAAVTDAEVAAYFEPLGSQELRFSA